MSTLTLRVPDELDRALERQSASLGISKSDLAREALKRYLRVAAGGHAEGSRHTAHRQTHRAPGRPGPSGLRIRFTLQHHSSLGTGTWFTWIERFLAIACRDGMRAPSAL
jgi:hypothetical protein